MEKLLQGVLKFKSLVRPSLLPQLEKLAHKAQVCLLQPGFSVIYTKDRDG